MFSNHIVTDQPQGYILMIILIYSV